MALNDDEEKKLKADHESATKAKDDEIAKLKADLEASKKPASKEKKDDEGDEDDESEDDGDLRSKVKKEKEAEENRKLESKRIESALKFNLSINAFVKEHEDILPSELNEILKAAEREKYDSAIERANVVKKHLIEAFFEIQSNLDLLTSNQKQQLDDYLKLTKNGKEQKAEFIFENIFEPAIESLKRIKKVEEVGKANPGFASGTKVENAYKEKLMNISKKAHLGEGGR